MQINSILDRCDFMVYVHNPEKKMYLEYLRLINRVQKLNYHLNNN